MGGAARERLFAFSFGGANEDPMDLAFLYKINDASASSFV
jgi:hypothetical protein